MKYFKHDSNASLDVKLKKLLRKYGFAGTGMYWYCVEMIASKLCKENISLALEEDSESLALEGNIDESLAEEMLNYMVSKKLFTKEDGKILCRSILKRLDDTQSKNPEIRAIIKESADSEENKEAPINSEMLGHTPKNSEELRKTPKDSEQIRLDKISNKTYAHFEEFWKAYPNKKSKGRAESAWKKIKPNEQLRVEILQGLEQAKTSVDWKKDNGQFIPHPATWLNARGWEDDHRSISIVQHEPRKML